MTADELAKRRKRILAMSAVGKTSAEIAKALGVTPSQALRSLKGARLHAGGAERFGEAPSRIHNILRRAGFNSRAEVVQAVVSGRMATLYVRNMGAGARAFILKEFRQ